MPSWESFPCPGGQPAAATRALLRAVMGLHSTYSDEIWLWRGQADAKHGLEPAIHTRLKMRGDASLSEANAVSATVQLLERARKAGLDELDGIRLPDLALLAHLQHHGAATPLMDVTVDPLVALWMVAFAGRAEPASLDDCGGLLFAIRRPPPKMWIDALDSRSIKSISDAVTQQGAVWYQAPDVSERLRIQRGSFVLAPLQVSLSPRATVSIGNLAPTKPGWLRRRIKRLGAAGGPELASSDVVVFKVNKALKSELRKWLGERAGLTPETVYPTPWHRPYLDEFCRAHRRQVPVDFEDADGAGSDAGAGAA